MAALKKFDEYCTLATNQQRSQSAIATICDTRYSLNVLEIIWPEQSRHAERTDKSSMARLYHKYSGKALDIQAAKVMESIQDEELEDENSKKTESDSKDELYVSQRQLDLDPMEALDKRANS